MVSGAPEAAEGLRSGPNEIVLSPFIAPLREQAMADLAAEIRSLLDAPSATVHAERAVSIATKGPTRILVREGDARLGMVLRLEPGGAWQAGPLNVTIEPEVDGKKPAAHATSRTWLTRLAEWFTTASAVELVERGAKLAVVHHRWATLRVIEDRDYRHVEHAHHGPAAFMRPSFRCNQDCHFCWEGRDWPEPPEQLVMTWFDELARSGARNITFCGGEPTLHKRLPDLVKRASRDHRMKVHLHTNAIRFRDAEYVRTLVEAGVSSLLISFHSADPDVSDAMTRARGTWRRTVDGIHAALGAGIPTALNCVVERANVEGLAAHARFVREQFVEAHPDNPVRMVNYSQPGKYYELDLFTERMVPFDVARPHVAAAARILHEAGVVLEITGTCGFPSCIASDIPELVPWRPNGTHDAAHTAGRQRAPDACQRCRARDHCVGVRHEYVDKFGDRGLVPFEQLPSSDWYERVARAGLGDGWASSSPAEP